MLDNDFSERVGLAHGDAWQQIGRSFVGRGGGVLTAPGIRLMASGLPHPQWNSGDITADDVDLELARDFYARHQVPWGLRVAPTLRWPHGRLLFSLRLMGLVPNAFSASETPPGVSLRTAEPADLEAVLAVDSAAFDTQASESREWIRGLLDAPDDRILVCAACLDGTVVGTGYGVSSDSSAGSAVYLAGVAVVPAFRCRGIGAALSTWILSRGFAAGADLAHLHADDDRAARLYARLGFVEAGALNVYGDM